MALVLASSGPDILLLGWEERGANFCAEIKVLQLVRYVQRTEDSSFRQYLRWWKCAAQIRVLSVLLNSEHWRFFPLTLQVLSTDFFPLLHGMPALPDHISIHFGPPEVVSLIKAAADIQAKWAFTHSSPAAA